MWCHVCGKLPTVACKRCGIVVYCSEECWDCDADNHYEWCTPCGLQTDNQGPYTTEPITKGTLLWKERAVCKQSTMLKFANRLKTALPDASAGTRSKIRAIESPRGGFCLFLTTALCASSNDPNAFYDIEYKSRDDYILSVHASTDIKAGERINITRSTSGSLGTDVELVAVNA